jgi:hypothetical protein
MFFFTILWLVASGVLGGANPQGIEPEVNPSTGLYLIDGRITEIGKIAMAVARREGSWSCGIKVRGEYVKLPKDEGLRLCAAKLGKQLDKDDFETVMKRWKTVPPFTPYINDIKSILYQQS